MALYDPFGVDVPLNLDITHSPILFRVIYQNERERKKERKKERKRERERQRERQREREREKEMNKVCPADC